MLNINIISCFLVLIVTLTKVNSAERTRCSCSNVVRTHYEETSTYSRNPECMPSKLDRGIKCSDVRSTLGAGNAVLVDYGLHYVPLASAYFVARLADAWGYQKRCPTNTTFLRQLDVQAAWSGGHGAVSVDLACGYRNVLSRQCTFPTEEYPFLCKGTEGGPETYGRRIEDMSYTVAAKGVRWTLFVHCWRAKTPENPQSEEIATSFNVYNTDPKLCDADRAYIIRKLKKLGFNTDPENLIEFDYSTTDCS